MKYIVHLYTAVRISMEGVEAGSQEEAFAKAGEECDVRQSLAYGAFEDDEAPFLGATVDEEGDEDFKNTRYHQGLGAEKYLGHGSAALIIAAPTLLELLEEYKDFNGLYAASMPREDWVRRVYTAIAEAKGAQLPDPPTNQERNPCTDHS